MSKIRIWSLLAMLAFAGVACASDEPGTATDTTPTQTAPATTSPAAEATVTATSTATVWTPADVTITAKGTVTWDWDGDLPHDVMAADGSFESGEAVKKDTFIKTFEAAGTYVYYCSVHGTKEGAGMAGKITVV